MTHFSPTILEAIETLRAGLLTGRRFQKEPWPLTGLLLENPLDSVTTPRFINIPPEAFPILRSGADGVHYALWIDDPGADAVPPVVRVAPKAGLPERISLVAHTPAEFLELIEITGTAREKKRDVAAQYEEQAALERAAVIRYPTMDSLGVVCPEEPGGERPKLAELKRWAGPEGSGQFHEAVGRLLAQGSPGLALAAARDLIVDAYPVDVTGFEDACGRVYRRLGRDLLADVVAATLDWHRRMA